MLKYAVHPKWLMNLWIKVSQFINVMIFSRMKHLSQVLSHYNIIFGDFMSQMIRMLTRDISVEWISPQFTVDNKVHILCWKRNDTAMSEMMIHPINWFTPYWIVMQLSNNENIALMKKTAKSSATIRFLVAAP
jgi:hypothetical protein